MKTSDGYFTTGSLLRGDLRIGTRATISVPIRTADTGLELRSWCETVCVE